MIYVFAWILFFLISRICYRVPEELSIVTEIPGEEFYDAVDHISSDLINRTIDTNANISSDKIDMGRKDKSENSFSEQSDEIIIEDKRALLNNGANSSSNNSNSRLTMDFKFSDKKSKNIDKKINLDGKVPGAAEAINSTPTAKGTDTDKSLAKKEKRKRDRKKRKKNKKDRTLELSEDGDEKENSLRKLDSSETDVSEKDEISKEKGTGKSKRRKTSDTTSTALEANSPSSDVIVNSKGCDLELKDGSDGGDIDSSDQIISSSSEFKTESQEISSDSDILKSDSENVQDNFSSNLGTEDVYEINSGQSVNKKDVADDIVKKIDNKLENSLTEKMAIPTENKDFPIDNKDVESGNKDIPTESTDILTESTDILTESTDIPTVSTDIPTGGKYVHTEGKDVQIDCRELLESPESSSKKSSKRNRKSKNRNKRSSTGLKDVASVSASQDMKELPVCKEGFSVTKEETTAIKQGSPVTKEEASVTKEHRSPIKKGVHASKEEQSVIKEEPSVTKEEQSVTKEEQSVPKEKSSVTKEEQSVTKEEQSVIKEAASVTNEEVFVTNEEVSVIKESAIEESEKEEAVSEKPKVVPEDCMKEEAAEIFDVKDNPHDLSGVLEEIITPDNEEMIHLSKGKETEASQGVNKGQLEISKPLETSKQLSTIEPSSSLSVTETSEEAKSNELLEVIQMFSDLSSQMEITTAYEKETSVDRNSSDVPKTHSDPSVLLLSIDKQSKSSDVLSKEVNDLCKDTEMLMPIIESEFRSQLVKCDTEDSIVNFEIKPLEYQGSSVDLERKCFDSIITENVKNAPKSSEAATKETVDVCVGTSEAGMETVDVGTETSEAVIQTVDVGIGTSEVVKESSDVCTETLEVFNESIDACTETSEVVKEGIDVGMGTSEFAMETADVSVETSEVVIETSDVSIETSEDEEKIMMKEEIELLKQEVKSTKEILQQSQSHLYRHQIHTNLTVTSLQAQLRKKELEMKSKQVGHDHQISAIISRLFLLEGQLRREQKQILGLLELKETVIDRQSAKIEDLSARNDKLSIALKLHNNGNNGLIQTINKSTNDLSPTTHKSFKEKESPKNIKLRWGTMRDKLRRHKSSFELHTPDRLETLEEGTFRYGSQENLSSVQRRMVDRKERCRSIAEYPQGLGQSPLLELPDENDFQKCDSAEALSVNTESNEESFTNSSDDNSHIIDPNSTDIRDHSVSIGNSQNEQKDQNIHTSVENLKVEKPSVQPSRNIPSPTPSESNPFKSIKTMLKRKGSKLRNKKQRAVSLPQGTTPEQNESVKKHFKKFDMQ
ncbi:uncharacterized protein PF3D7_1120000 isoform X2 [Patella vulgata]|uniref:uncharacterized protein PF3D7_1120000 isoform X2 n=1 Tax=Patella vulgata TaxID=6465 RepID=UPI0021807EF2|nr:uncharacterized protein PF3D7_1120000 isoform X2 [Patella vulgata]